MPESEYVDQVMQEITLPGVTNVRVWMEVTEIQGEKYYHFKVEKTTEGWFYVGLSRNQYPADVVFCGDIGTGLTVSCVDGYISNLNLYVDTDTSL